jgi:hypothetical protein
MSYFVEEKERGIFFGGGGRDEYRCISAPPVQILAIYGALDKLDTRATVDYVVVRVCFLGPVTFRLRKRYYK